MQYVPGVVFPDIKRQGSEADLIPSSAEVKNGGAIPALPYILMAWCLIN
jgi:hypothetical protein